MSSGKTLKYLANSVWRGTLNGNGMVTSGGNAFKKGLPLEVPALARGVPDSNQDENKTNPEELVAAAHSACFTMTLSAILGAHKLSPKEIDTKGTLTLEKRPDGFKVSSIHLTCSGNVPGIDENKFKEYANMAKKNCPMSKLFNNNCDISLDAKLV
ncbi:hypothetical protein ACTFIY_011505 [Dictyostelium cf. discoideum]